MADFGSSLAFRELSTRVLWTYWPITVAIACYVPFLLTSLRLKTHSTARKTWLELGSSIMVTIWALITVRHLILVFDAPHGRPYPQTFFLVGVDATFVLALVLVVVAVRVAISHHLAISTGISLGAVAAVAAVYANLVFALLVSTPFG